MKRKVIGILTALLMTGAAAGAAAADADGSVLLQTEAQRTDALGARHGQTAVQTRIASQFSAFAGSDANAQSLVTGLRNGTPITLSATTVSTGGATSTTSTTIEPGTRPMGYGNVFISLALAQQQLARYGVNDPTPQEMQAALTGGTITSATGQPVTLQGVLAQRASGQGWGTIARSQDTNLGHVISALKGVNQQVTVQPTMNQGVTDPPIVGPRATAVSTGLQGSVAGDLSSPAHGRGALGGSASGIVNAGGQHGNVNAGVSSGVHVQSSGGIVTGAGVGVGVSGRGAVAPGLANGHAKP